MVGGSEKSQLTPRLLTTVSIICLGSLQFGYHMSELNSPESIISCRATKPGSVPYEQSFFGARGFVRCIPLSAEQVGLVTSIFSIGGLIGSFYVGSVCDKLGRKKTCLLHCLIYFVGSTLNGLSNNYISLLLGRFIAGLGAGAALVVTPLFINEISPVANKGLLGAMNQFSVNVGILFTQLLALSWTNNNDWRYLLLMGGLIAIINFIVVGLYVEESPMWLFNNGYAGDSFTILHKLRGGQYSDSRAEVNSWGASSVDDSLSEGDHLLAENSHNNDLEASNPRPDGSASPSAITLEMYLKSSEFNNSKIVATGILILQQFCGINSIIFYGVSVLISIFPNYAILLNFMISIVNVVVTFASATFVDKLGRKPLLLSSVLVMGFLTFLIGIGIIFTSSVFSIVGTFTYITFFAVGLGPIPFLLVSEVTQPKAKALAQSWGTTMNWLATFIVGLLFPILKNSKLGGGVYFIFTIMCGFTYWFIKTKIPETRGLSSYEEVWGLVRA